jgi:hypothetical protein
VQIVSGFALDMCQTAHFIQATQMYPNIPMIKRDAGKGHTSEYITNVPKVMITMPPNNIHVAYIRFITV